MNSLDSLESRIMLSASVPQFSHIVVLLEENHASEEIYGGSDDPFLNSLASGGAEFSQSYAITHPSQPNYFALFSGSTHGVTDDGSYTYNSADIASELQAAGLSFTGYAQATVDPAHDPWQSFTNSAADQLSTSQFPTDFSQLPALSYVVPNLNNDMHDGTIAQADSWAQAHLGAYATWAKSNNSLLIVEWDEDDYTNNNGIPTIIYGAHVTPGVYSETINDYSLLATVEDSFGIPLLGQSANASPITDIFKNSSKTGSSKSSSTAPALSTIEVNGVTSGSASLDSLTLDFSEPITMADDTITLTRISPKTRAETPVKFKLNTSDGQSWTMTFTGHKHNGGSLKSGVFVLNVAPDGVTNTQGQSMSAGTETYSLSRIRKHVTGDGTDKHERFGQHGAKDGFRKFVKQYESQLSQ